MGKTTIYRWWPSKGAVVLELLDQTATAAAAPPDTGDLAADLRTLLTEVIGMLTPPHTSPATGLIAEALQDPALGRELRERLIEPRIATFEQRLRRAQEAASSPPMPTSRSRSTCSTARSTTAWRFTSTCPTPTTSTPSSPTSCARSPRRRRSQRRRAVDAYPPARGRYRGSRGDAALRREGETGRRRAPTSRRRPAREAGAASQPTSSCRASSTAWLIRREMLSRCTSPSSPRGS
ncbi:TetR-like C-terminal domain-containing protein [Oerskovia sp. M15]